MKTTRLEQVKKAIKEIKTICDENELYITFDIKHNGVLIQDNVITSFLKWELNNRIQRRQ